MQFNESASVRSGGFDEHIETFGSILEAYGLNAALSFLNRLTGHRLTGVYRFDPPILRNVAVYDAENPTLRVAADAPLMETYCSIVGRDADAFTTADAPADGRLAGHAARDNVQSYAGVPLRGADGEPFGSLCHFDFRPRASPPREQMELLEAAADLIARHIEPGDDA